MEKDSKTSIAKTGKKKKEIRRESERRIRRSLGQKKARPCPSLGQTKNEQRRQKETIMKWREGGHG